MRDEAAKYARVYRREAENASRTLAKIMCNEDPDYGPRAQLAAATGCTVEGNNAG